VLYDAESARLGCCTTPSRRVSRWADSAVSSLV